MQQSSSPKADDAKQWLEQAVQASLPRGAEASRQWTWRAATAGAVILAYLVISLISRAQLSQIYTVNWMAGGIAWFFAPVGVFLAVAGLLRSAGWSVLGYIVSTTIGEMIGSPIYQFQSDYIQRRLDDPAYVQEWEPIQPAWWIALGLFIYITCAAAFVEWRERGRGAAMSKG